MNEFAFQFIRLLNFLLNVVTFLQIFQRIQQQAAFIEFSRKNFDDALDLFKGGKVDVREVCATKSLYACRLFLVFRINMRPIFRSWKKFLALKSLSI